MTTTPQTDTARPARTALDTVEQAARTPGDEQPWAELGLKQDEYERIREILGRRPTGAELAMYSVMWSEHCSYKSSKVHLKQFGEKAPQSDALLVGIGENAGVVDIGQDYAEPGVASQREGDRFTGSLPAPFEPEPRPPRGRIS
jgi:phosphoribosylformylglycinamidine synthase